MATGFAVWAVLRCPILQASYWGAAGAAVGYLIPGLWLSVAGQKRRRILRKGMPDALDLLVLCMDGGLSLNAAMQMVIEELDAHPELSTELGIVHREIQMGLPTGQALRKFADRCDLADVRDLASIILQAEKLGASISQTLRNFADSYRLERHQKAEETAQKAAVKVLFPTLLCIFPAMFIVLMGPAAFQLTKLFHR
jgi:tight adherence protein C